MQMHDRDDDDVLLSDRIDHAVGKTIAEQNSPDPRLDLRAALGLCANDRPQAVKFGNEPSRDDRPCMLRIPASSVVQLLGRVWIDEDAHSQSGHYGLLIGELFGP